MWGAPFFVLQNKKMNVSDSYCWVSIVSMRRKNDYYHIFNQLADDIDMLPYAQIVAGELALAGDWECLLHLKSSVDKYLYDCFIGQRLYVAYTDLKCSVDAPDHYEVSVFLAECAIKAGRGCDHYLVRVYTEKIELMILP